MRLDEKLLRAIEEIAQFWAIETIQKLSANVKRKKLTNTRQLLNSLNQEARLDLSRAVTAIVFGFEEYGRYQDMKKNIWTSHPPIQEILEWIKKKGLQAFGQDPSPNKFKAKTSERRMNEIAWGISRKRFKHPRSRKARPWFQSTFYKSLNALETQLLRGVGDEAIEDVKDMLLLRLKGKL